MIYPISIDEKKADAKEFYAIRNNTNCINCYKPYAENDKVIFTTLTDGSVLWWHSIWNGTNSIRCDTGVTVIKKKIKIEDPYKKFEQMRKNSLKNKQKRLNYKERYLHNHDQ